MRFLYRLTLALVTLALPAGCAGGSGDPSPSPTSVTSSPTDTGRPAVVEIWHALPTHQAAALSAVVDTFSQRTPTLDVRLRAYAPAELCAAYESAVDGGGGPALIMTAAKQHAALIAGGRLAPVSRALTDRLENLLPRSITTRQNGAVYGVPFSVDFPLLFYDRTRVSAPPATLDNLKAAAADHGLVITPDLWTTAALHPALGEQLVAGTLQRATLWVFFDTLASFAAAPGVRFEASSDALTRREVGLLLAPGSTHLLLHSSLGAELGTAPLPYAASGDPRPLARMQYAGFNINNTRAENSAAEQFVLFLLGEEAQRQWFEATGQPPANPAGITDEALGAAWRETVRSAQSAPLQPAFFSTWLPALDDAILSLAAGEGDPVTLAAGLSSLFGAPQD